MPGRKREKYRLRRVPCAVCPGNATRVLLESRTWDITGMITGADRWSPFDKSVLSAVEACPVCSRKGLRANGKGRGQSASGNGTGHSWPRARRRGSRTCIAASPAVCVCLSEKRDPRPMIGTAAPRPRQGCANEQGFLCSADRHPACYESAVRDDRTNRSRRLAR